MQNLLTINYMFSIELTLSTIFKLGLLSLNSFQTLMYSDEFDSNSTFIQECPAMFVQPCGISVTKYPYR